MRRTLSALLAAILLLCTLPGCAAQPVTRDIFAMDTVMSLKIWGSAGAADAVVDLINDLEQELSVTIPTSEVAQLNAAGSLTVSPDTAQLLWSAWNVSRKTGGALDITLGPLMELWGFRSGDYAVPDPASLQAALDNCGWDRVFIDEENTVTLDPGMELDLGAVAKGYAAQRAVELLERQYGVQRAVLSLGGNVQTLGQKADGSPWRIAVTDPQDPSASLGTLLLEGSWAVVTSGGYQRYFEEDGVTYHHILDPETGYPADSGLSSVTIIAASGLTADALSTALFVAGMEQAMSYYNAQTFGAFEAVFVTSDGEILVTPGLEGRFEASRTWQVAET